MGKPEGKKITPGVDDVRDGLQRDGATSNLEASQEVVGNAPLIRRDLDDVLDNVQHVHIAEDSPFLGDN